MAPLFDSLIHLTFSLRSGQNKITHEIAFTLLTERCNLSSSCEDSSESLNESIVIYRLINYDADFHYKR